MTFEELRELVGVLFIVGGLLNIFSPGRGYSPGGRATAIAIGVILVVFGLSNATAGLQESMPAVFHFESNATVVLYVLLVGLFFLPGRGASEAVRTHRMREAISSRKPTT